MEIVKSFLHSTAMRGLYVLICIIIAVLIRLYSVLRYESVIHEFDPYFNYRASKYLLANGLDAFNNWFDETAWYPLGRIVGVTVYPGLMYTSVFFFRLLEFLHLSVDIKEICVFMGPFFSGLTVLVGYRMTIEIASQKAALIAALLIAIVPGYISRSVAGSYDNECISIFALLLTFYLWIRAVKSGSPIKAALCALAYYYMALSWGAYVFIINLIPLHAFLLLVFGRFTNRLYTAYTTFYIIGILLSMQVSFIGFQPIRSSEHMASMFVFIFIQLYIFFSWIKSKLSEQQFKRFYTKLIMTSIITGILVITVLTLTGKISPWTGRFYALLDPTYAKEHIPIIASVSEHQPTSWGTFFFDLHIVCFFIPLGIYFMLKNITDESIFTILLVMTTVYFSGVMSRLILILSTGACIVASIGISEMYNSVVKVIFKENQEQNKKVSNKKKQTSSSYDSLMQNVGIFIFMILSLCLLSYTNHCLFVGRESYSSPSIVMKVPTGANSFIVFDDFRDSYRWLNQNTPKDSKIMSWWDYGYQLAAVANRTTIVDNNTWNNSHIARVGGAFAKSEKESYKILKELDVDYVLVIFGGVIGFSGDDINKFLWMVRIGGTIDPTIQESDYYSKTSHELEIGENITSTMKNSLMYKLCYYRFGELMTEKNKPTGFDRARNKEIGYKDIELDHLEEVFTSVHWMVRIYKVKKDNNRIYDIDSLHH
ncbi:dolichyl-diphosphooligosaccharide--protein glycosyltransferase subunit STT3A, putative [Entamoeba dispar SAW760]|uniref:dolichyl-diphosphooligosaccharide--protein glycotransferase n=1 Tax=Entamoeba dispar (strain ATCC PRA-260 / SAW760) TaxID=370354 RepID=B0E7C4_ENTDS|nr:dolichyl-diphosphooligosaccharide--protein glycosyltransferase subunit STT3A, putative [Entamoeba dispar SAW760]EDR29572.1 dolichyl-diphosphooligosaccharide--protein glycosyltransferase subunit STT3A, putative [Entamoeba dispar SAW760]|eukprot:EDR29572.1 dolichyl-diphosphooligosaccharide--protein glycosyltransferase subunit STT3A, putative [Entamoeba dispar SAW760]